MTFFRSVLLLGCVSGSLAAQPSGMEVASGQADATAALSNVLEVQASDHAIIHWDQFSIGSSEIVKFVLHLLLEVLYQQEYLKRAIY